MALVEQEFLTLIINGVPITTLNGVSNLEVSQNSNFNSSETSSSNPIAFLGTSFERASASSSKVFSSEKMSSTVEVRFIVSKNSEDGLIIINSLLAIDSLIRSFLNIPCQLFGSGIVMALGVVKANNFSFKQLSDSKYECSFAFERRSIPEIITKACPQVPLGGGIL